MFGKQDNLFHGWCCTINNIRGFKILVTSTGRVVLLPPEFCIDSQYWLERQAAVKKEKTGLRINKDCLLDDHPYSYPLVDLSFFICILPQHCYLGTWFSVLSVEKLERKPTVDSAYPIGRKAITKKTITKFIIFFHKHYWERLLHLKNKNACGEILKKVLHKCRACCVGVSHNSKRAEQTFFISINNMLLFICVERFTESFLLALDHSTWQYKHRNSMNTENQRRKIAVQSYWDLSNHSSMASHTLDIADFFTFTSNTNTVDRVQVR